MKCVMKGIIKASVIGLTFAAAGAFAQSTYTPPTESTYTQPPATRDAKRLDNRRYQDSRQVDSTWHGATAAPYAPGDDIRNANSALWGVGG